LGRARLLPTLNLAFGRDVTPAVSFRGKSRLAAEPSVGRASLVEAPHVAPHAAATHGLYERHATKIQSYCQHQLGSREEAEDAVQTTFINAFRALGRGVVPEAESAWLFKIAENVCLSRRRSSWRRGRIESPSDFGVIEEIVAGPNRQHDELIGIEDALASMPEQQRRAILLREWQGLSYREVAEELEISQSAVETLIFRARRSLAQGLEQPEQAKPKRKSFRRALHALDIGTLIAAVKTVLAGSAAVKATAVAVAVTAAAGTAATVGPKVEPRSPQLASAPKHVVAAPERATISVAAPVSFAPVTGKASESATGEQTRVQRQRERAARPLTAGSVSASLLAAAPVAPVAVAPAEPVAEQAPPLAEPQSQPQPQPEPQPQPQQEPAAQPAPPAAAPAAAATPPQQGKDEGKSHKQRQTEAVTTPATPSVPVVEPTAAASNQGRGSSRRGGNSNRSAKLNAIIAQAPALLESLLPVATPAPTSAPTVAPTAPVQEPAKQGEPVATPAKPAPVVAPVAPVAPIAPVAPVATVSVVTQPVKPAPTLTPAQQFLKNVVASLRK
jgi:RNA polymerase sigma factor (sigma-70 family)